MSTRNTLIRILKNRMALAGILIILFFSAVALLAPVLTPVNPVKSIGLASPLSVPVWATNIPIYRHLPVDTEYIPNGGFATPKDLNSWWLMPSNDTTVSGVTVTYHRVSLEPGNVANTGLEATINGRASNASLSLARQFTYTYKPPHRFVTGFKIYFPNITPSSLVVTVTIMGPANNYTLWQQTLSPSNKTWYYITADSTSQQMIQEISPSNPLAQIAPIVLSRTGNYTLVYKLTFPNMSHPFTVYIASAFFYVYGSAYGVMGTDNQGRSVWSQFVYGAQTSLEIGLLAALLTISLATIVGVASGYYVGIIDEVLMRVNDILLSIPVLPLLLVLILIIDLANIRINLNDLIILLIGFLGWQVYARAIRSQALSLKERTYVRAAKMIGVKSTTIIRRHLVPNIAGLIFSLLAQAVPTAIILQAALSYLGFFDPNVFSWGRMIGEAQAYVVSPTSGFVWWWFLPPGIAIALVSLAFVLLGNALNEEFNPNIRKRA